MTDILKELDKLAARIEDYSPIDDVGRASIDFIDMNYDAIRAALELKARVDAGWVLVPREPTQEQFDAGFNACGKQYANEYLDDQVEKTNAIYSAMLNAAPPAQESEDDAS